MKIVEVSDIAKRFGFRLQRRTEGGWLIIHNASTYYQMGGTLKEVGLWLKENGPENVKALAAKGLDVNGKPVGEVSL